MMTILRAINAICIAAGLSLTAPAIAAPALDAPSHDSGLVINVRGCHGDAQRHFVPEFGRTVLHRHRRPDCRPVQAAGPGVGPRDCHRDVRRHFLPEFRGSVPHRHVGNSCRVRVYQRFNPNRPRPGSCIQIGPVRYCEY